VTAATNVTAVPVGEGGSPVTARSGTGVAASILPSPTGHPDLGVEAGGPAPAGRVRGEQRPAGAPLIVGLDLSLTGTGMSDGDTTWLIRSSGKKDDDLPKRQARLRKLRAQVITRCDGAGLVVIEGPSYGTSSGHMHDRSGLWWLVVQALAYRNITVVEVAPATLKKYATGKGNGPKGAVIEAAARRLPDIETGGDDNRADALWLHAMGRDHLTGLYVVPESHRIALKSVRWPVMGAT
jgi:crossover junction endodeoxyribonuclease RuvC